MASRKELLKEAIKEANKSLKESRTLRNIKDRVLEREAQFLASSNSNSNGDTEPDESTRPLE